MNTILKKVALDEEWWTAAANKYTNGQGWHRTSLKWNRAGASDTGRAADNRVRERSQLSEDLQKLLVKHR